MGSFSYTQIKKFIIDDNELVGFLDKCENETEDPHSNNIFNDDQWPDLNVQTNIEEFEFNQFKKDIPIIKKYTNIF